MSSRPRTRRRRTSIAICVVLVAGLFASTAARTEVPRRCNAVGPPEDALRRLNEARAHGAVCGRVGDLTAAAPVRWNASLEAAALTQSEEMALLGRMGHRDRLNRGLTERLTANGYRFSSAVENVAVGYPSVDAVVDAWLKSEGHCENLMNRAALELGMACIDGGSLNDANSADEIGGRRYWTLVLGAPRRAR